MQVITLEEVNSTNLYAKENLASFADKTVIRALRQSAGRGRFSRSWIDLGKENLFISFVLKPSDSFDPVYSNLTQYLSVVLCKLLEKYGAACEIKLPNDVLVNGKKIAGILAETVMSGNIFKGLVLGIGVNLNADPLSLSKITGREAAALNIELNREISAEHFLHELTSDFFAGYDEFLNKGFSFIKSDYISRASFIDTEVCVQCINDKKCGIAKGVNDFGELVLDAADGQCVLNIGDIL